MISPVSFGAGPSTAPARATPEEVAKRLEAAVKGARTSSDIGESRVRISPEGALRAQAEAQALQRQQDESASSAPPLTGATSAPPASPASNWSASVATDLQAFNDLSFAAADSNQDGSVTVSEEQNFEVRTVRVNFRQPADGRPGPAGSGPIRAYRDVDATSAGI